MLRRGGWGWGASPQGLQTTRLHHAPGSRSSSTLEARRPRSSYKLSHRLHSGQSVPVPRRGTLALLGAPHPPCNHPSICRETLHLPLILTASFREPLTPLHLRFPHHGSVSRSLTSLQETSPSHRLHLQGALFRTPHSSSNSQAFPPASLLRSSKGRSALVGGGKPPPPPPTRSGDPPLTSAVRDVFTEESLLLSRVQQGWVFEQQE